jgi:hypothetical protein
METLLDVIQESAEGPTVQLEGIPVAEVMRRLEAGEAPHRVGGLLNLDAARIIAVLAYAGLGPEGSEGLPLIQAAPRRPQLAGALSEPSVSALLPEARRPARLALGAGLLQIHDFWEASHEAAQQADDLGEPSFSAYWHGIAHRREPDSGNAAYWFRRVGRHPVFGPLAQAAGPLLAGSALADRLVHQGQWDPNDFIAVCAAAQPGSGDERLARRLQRLEMAILLDATARALV